MSQILDQHKLWQCKQQYSYLVYVLYHDSHSQFILLGNYDIIFEVIYSVIIPHAHMHKGQSDQLYLSVV